MPQNFQSAKKLLLCRSGCKRNFISTHSKLNQKERIDRVRLRFVSEHVGLQAFVFVLNLEVADNRPTLQ